MAQITYCRVRRCVGASAIARLRFHGGMIENDDRAPIRQGDNARCSQARELAADRFDRKAKQVGHLLARERQIEALGSVGLSASGARRIQQPLRHFENNGGDTLASALAAKEQHPMPGAVKLCQSALEQFMLKLGMGAGKAIKGGTGEQAKLRIRQCRHAMLGGLAEWTPNEIGRINDTDDLLAPIGR